MSDVGMKGTATACGISELPNTPDPYHTEAARLTKPKPSSKHAELPVICFPCLKCISIRERDRRERERERNLPQLVWRCKAPTLKQREVV